MKMQKSTMILSVALAVVVIVAIIFFSSFQIQLQQDRLNINHSADVFDSKLHDLLQEHTFLLINTVRRSLDSGASYNASLVALQNNINEVGQLLTPIYGSAGSQQLVNLWNLKANIFINYSIALKNNDSTANAVYNSAAAAYEQQVLTFWETTNNPYPVFNNATIQPLIVNHMNYVKAAIDDWNAKNYPLYFTDLEIAYKEMGVYADVIATGIIQQNPQDFP